MKAPCSNCPFRKDKPFPLEPERSREIAEALMRDGSFHCHKTVDYSDEMSGGGRVTRESALCTGAAIFLENVRAGGMLANLAFRFAFRTGELDPQQLDRSIPVYKSIKDFYKGTSLLNCLRSRK